MLNPIKLNAATWSNLKMTALINALSAIKIPLLGFVTPRVIQLDERRAEVRIRLGRRTQNHLGVMYFGALAMGAELSIALKAIEAINRSGKRIDFIFKDFSAEFLRRAEGHVHFVCDEAAGVQTLINQAAAGEDRHHHTFNGYAIVPGSDPNHGTDPVMTYKLTLSVRQRRR